MPRLTGLFIYPVKSLRGYPVESAGIDAHGLVGDRRFLVVDADGKFLTQRSVPGMARVDARLQDGTLTLSAEGAGHVSVPTPPDPTAPLRRVSIWKSEGLAAEDCGVSAGCWLSDTLGLPCHLVRLGPAYVRPVLKPAARPGDVVSFADAAPVLLVNESSLDHLNDRILENQGETVPLDRFRPNLVITGCDAFAEDAWSHVKIGEILFRQGGPSARCAITTTDQQTGQRGREPLRTLATFRRDLLEPTAVNFGANLIHETKHGRLRVGDAVLPEIAR